MNIVVSILTAVVAVLNRIIVALTVTNTIVELEAIDVELETVTEFDAQLSFLGILDAARVADWTIDTSVEIEVVTPVEVVNFDDAAILAALGLVTEAPVEEVVEVVAPVETVVVNNVTYVIRYMTNVDVQFSGRVHGVFVNAAGYLFEGDNGTSDFLLRIHAPISLDRAKEWMELGGEESARYRTQVIVTPTYTRFN